MNEMSLFAGIIIALLIPANVIEPVNVGVVVRLYEEPLPIRIAPADGSACNPVPPLVIGILP